ncbi:MAG: polysaccharide biosynthesis/export family protein [Deltaproteobacteria bacterium]|nr:polysaccharide biosynthesis/export family protein [Deltaproteobacteria bacterium]
MRSRSPLSRFLVGALVVLGVVAGAGMTCGVPPASELPAPESAKADMLGPGDVVEVRIFNEPDLSGTHQISDNGTIRLPLVGAVDASGMTPDQLTLKIAATYNERYLKDAEVSLFVKEHNSRKIYVLGQVAKPGPYAFDGRMTIIDAVALAGGTTKLADPDRTLITRDKDGKQLRVVVRVASIGEGRSPDILLQPGDIIFVPETPF